MKTQQLHEDTFLKILWDEKSRVIGIDWKEATSSMTGEEFKKELTLFADHVEAKKAHGILIDVALFRHKPGPDMQEWRVKNISRRYYGAGVRRFAFLFLRLPCPVIEIMRRGFSGPSWSPTTSAFDFASYHRFVFGDRKPADVAWPGFSTSLRGVRSSRYALLWLRHQGRGGRGHRS